MPGVTKEDGANRRQSLILGATIALIFVVVYLTLRPPLFDIDGFPDRLDALEPEGIYNVNPSHLLWIPLQMGLLQISDWIGHPNTIFFQVFGILVSATVLFLFCLLLLDLSQSASFALCAMLFVALSPWFWYVTLQNRVYPIVFLSMVLFLWAWNTPDGEPPSGVRLIGSGLCLLVAISLHQAVAVLVPGVVLVLIFLGSDNLRTKLIRGLALGGSITLCVAVAYFLFWWTLFSDQSFTHWASGYVSTIHPLEGPSLSVLTSFARAAIGLSGALVQSAPIQDSVADISSRIVLAIYGAVGLLVSAALIVAVFYSSARKELAHLVRHNALFAVSLVWILLWSVFVIAWEASSSHYWTLIIFPAIACLGLLIRSGWGTSWKVPAMSAVVILSGWNAYFNYANDQALSRNFPEPILASIDRHVGPRDVFIVLGKAWYGDMDYELIFMSLDHTAEKNRGLAILDDLVYPSKGADSWRRELSDRIDSTIRSGGHVYVAEHVLVSDTYGDLCDSADPFSPYVDASCAAVNGSGLCQGLAGIFAPYDQRESNFSIGKDKYYLLVRRSEPAASASDDSDMPLADCNSSKP